MILYRFPYKYANANLEYVSVTLVPMGDINISPMVSDVKCYYDCIGMSFFVAV